MDDDILDELDLNEDDIMDDDLEDDEGLDSGIGSQEMSTAEGSPSTTTLPRSSAEAPLETAAAVLHAMSTGVGLPKTSSSSSLGSATNIVNRASMPVRASPTTFIHAASVPTPRCIEMEV